MRQASRWLVLGLLMSCMVISAAQAGRFKRYPDEAPEQPAPAAPVPVAAPVPSPQTPARAGVNIDASRNRLAEDLAESPSDADLPPGLLGGPLHGTDGLRLEYIYTSDLFCQTRGGKRTRDAIRYLGLFDLACTTDLEQLGSLPGGTIFLLGEFSHGEGLSERFVGDYQFIDNIDAGYDLSQMSEFWWEYAFADAALTVRLGKQDANALFGFLDLGGDFLNSSFGMLPNIPMPAWPAQAMGAVVLLQLPAATESSVGFFDGAAAGSGWGVSGTGVSFTIAQCRRDWSLFDEFPGDAQIGGWYHSLTYDHLGGGSPRQGNYGFYVGAEQLIVREDVTDADNDQGWGLFAQYSWAPADRNAITQYLGGGCVYKGLLPGRDADVAGLGVAQRPIQRSVGYRGQRDCL